MKLGWIGGFLAGALGIAAWGWVAPPRALVDRVVAANCDCPGPLVVARAALKEQKREQQLLVSSIRFDASATTEEPLFTARPDGMPDILWQLISTRTSVKVPVTIDYTVDLADMSDADLSWDEPSRTLTVRRPELALRGPQIAGIAARVEVSNGFVLWISGAEEKLTETALAALTANAEAAARRDKPIAQANADADQAIARTFELPLRAAGFRDAEVKVTRAQG
jgi:hypothetical protein